MKISTLHQIAKQISTDRSIQSGVGATTVNSMTAMLKNCCEGIKTRRAAAKAIAMEIFDADEETATAIAKEI